MIHAARLILAITATMLSGCAWAKYRAYEGGQQEQWPTSQGAFVERNHAIPAYFSPPPRPYRVIGYIDATTAPIRRGGVVAFAARRAKEQGADAIIVLEEGSEYGGSFAFASGSTTSNYTGDYSGTSDFTGRAQYLGDGTTRFSGNVERRGMLRGFGTSSSFASATSVPVYRGTAQVIAIKWKRPQRLNKRYSQHASAVAELGVVGVAAHPSNESQRVTE
ncbi:MAG: hypothetical protein DVB27_10505 [Verrucomicrobia bacterium]|nr:MAG: hypothetical protein DVB27_10505 [Verrucomicrobiota bacterium]